MRLNILLTIIVILSVLTLLLFLIKKSLYNTIRKQKDLKKAFRYSDIVVILDLVAAIISSINGITIVAVIVCLVLGVI